MTVHEFALHCVCRYQVPRKNARAESMYHLWLEHLQNDQLANLLIRLAFVPLCLLVGRSTTMRMLSGSMADMKTWNPPVLWLAICGDRELAIANSQLSICQQMLVSAVI